MPVVVIDWWAGRTDEQKETIIKGITKAFGQIGIKPEQLQIIIHDVPKPNWGTCGEQASKLK